MNNAINSMVRIAHATKSIRQSLKEQEASNKSLRDQITPLWDKPEKDGVVSDLSRQLTVGRAKVRACQTALHELKKSFRNYNKRYDRSQRVRQ